MESTSKIDRESGNVSSGNLNNNTGATKSPASGSHVPRKIGRAFLENQPGSKYLPLNYRRRDPAHAH